MKTERISRIAQVVGDCSVKKKIRKIIALVTGDGSAPEMMRVACAVAVKAAEEDGLEVVFEETPMGWNAYGSHGDTLPPESLKRALEIGTVFLGGVGDFEHDLTIGVQKREMRPVERVLLPLRKRMGLLLNFRPIVFRRALAHLANVKPETIPEQGVEQFWFRFLLQDSYFGSADLAMYIDAETRRKLGIKPKHEVTGNEPMITELAYYRRETLEQYFRAAFAYARARGLPLISVSKDNVMARYDFWTKIVTRIGREEFSDVPLTHQLVDSANAFLFTPDKLRGVIACGNEHGDVLSDGAAAASGGMGMMCSSAVNPDTGAAMFESGAGTAPTLAGKNIANPLGRILTAAMMLRHIGASNGANAIEKAVNRVLVDGWRTADLASPSDKPEMILGTMEMGEKVLSVI